MPNYNNGKIYKIVNSIDAMVYIGSMTTKLCYRMAVHRCNMNNNNNATLYKHMRKLGVDNFKIVLFEYCSCNSKDELLRRERYIFDLHDKKILLNSNRPHTTCIEKKHYHNKYNKIWYVKNKNYNNEQTKQWRQNNKLYFKIYNIKYKEHQKIMMELPFYRVPLTTSF